MAGREGKKNMSVALNGVNTYIRPLFPSLTGWLVGSVGEQV